MCDLQLSDIALEILINGGHSLRHDADRSAESMPILRRSGGVRFTPNSGHEDGQLASPLWATSGLTQCNKFGEF